MEKNNKKKSPLDRFKLWMEETHPKKYISPTAGKKKAHPVIDRVKRFFKDVKEAIKEILNEVM